jgi:hypothetical protein
MRLLALCNNASGSIYCGFLLTCVNFLEVTGNVWNCSWLDVLFGIR